MNRQAAETMARRRANTSAKIADRERELARSARVWAQAAQDPGHRANLEGLSRAHDDAAARQAEASAYYRRLADRIAVGVGALGSANPPDSNGVVP